MKLIIDIPEDNIRVEYGEVMAIRSDKDILCNYIFHGTPLEKHDAEVFDKIRTEIEEIADEEQKHDKKWALGLRYAVKIIDKYRKENEE